MNPFAAQLVVKAVMYGQTGVYNVRMAIEEIHY